jgi:DNA-binding CsgD family transcriptional regulator
VRQWRLPGEEAGKPLSPRQREALRLFALTGSRKIVAQQLGISSSTVIFHLTKAYKRLDVEQQGHLEAFRKLGWLKVPES